MIINFISTAKGNKKEEKLTDATLHEASAPKISVGSSDTNGINVSRSTT